MAKRQVFYSFHYGNDCRRVQQIRNMGIFEGNEPVSAANWEEVKRKGDASIKKWIDDNMSYRSCVVVLIGSDTASRPWVKYEIQRAYELNKKIIGIYIHNLKDPLYGTCRQGANPFDNVRLPNGRLMSSEVKCYNPSSWDAYNSIKNNISNWIEE